ncbi:MAG: carboxypeptidase-like regulatory domain-containing protein [Acidobacteriota bacterium]
MINIPYILRISFGKFGSGMLKPTAHLVFFISVWTGTFASFQALAVEDAAESMVEGVVRDDEGFVAGAVVRVQTTQYSAVTGPNGEFRLVVPENTSDPVKLTAWAEGYFIVGPVDASIGDTEVTISLHRHNRYDNRQYAWLPAFHAAGAGENQACSECHFRGEDGAGPDLPVDEWLDDAHSQSAVNPRFLTLHTGKDMSGRRSPSTRFRRGDEGKLVPLPPAVDEPYYGPGYRLDNPDHTGDCAACHLPAAAINSPFNTDPVSVRGVGTEGVTCDVCHKVWDVRLDPSTGLPFPDNPGVVSFEFRRPFDGHQFFAGPLDDVAPGEDTYSGIQKQSRFCAPCHYGVFWGTVVYDSFGEWLRSPYSREGDEQTCQQCHMPSSGAEFFAHPEKGGLQRDPNTIVSHRMPGARDLELLQNAVSLDLNAERSTEGILVRTEIINDRTGHHVPTDSPLRHLILLVRAYDSSGSEISLRQGPVLPEWCGSGDPSNGFYAGLAGKVYVKLLEEKGTGISPTAAYWNPTRVVMDTRIGAFESDAGEFLFAAPASGDIRVEAVLLYRRAYKDLMDQKGWDEPDIVMESASLSLTQ